MVSIEHDSDDGQMFDMQKKMRVYCFSVNDRIRQIEIEANNPAGPIDGLCMLLGGKTRRMSKSLGS
jgi:hypothetical protein